MGNSSNKLNESYEYVREKQLASQASLVVILKEPFVDTRNPRRKCRRACAN